VRTDLPALRDMWAVGDAKGHEALALRELADGFAAAGDPRTALELFTREQSLFQELIEINEYGKALSEEVVKALGEEGAIPLSFTAEELHEHMRALNRSNPSLTTRELYLKMMEFIQDNSAIPKSIKDLSDQLGIDTESLLLDEGVDWTNELGEKLMLYLHTLGKN
jgi:hypothetical protein